MRKFSEIKAIAKAATEAVKDEVVEVREVGESKGRKFHSPVTLTPEAKEAISGWANKVKSTTVSTRNKMADVIAVDKEEV